MSESTNEDTPLMDGGEKGWDRWILRPRLSTQACAHSQIGRREIVCIQGFGLGGSTNSTNRVLPSFKNCSSDKIVEGKSKNSKAGP